MTSDEAIDAAHGELPVEALRYVNKARLRIILEAAAPHIIAQAGAAELGEAADAAEGMHEPAAPDCKEWADWLRARATRIANPYRSQQ